jgi:hypothetical protein
MNLPTISPEEVIDSLKKKQIYGYKFTDKLSVQLIKNLTLLDFEVKIIKTAEGIFLYKGNKRTTDDTKNAPYRVSLSQSQKEERATTSLHTHVEIQGLINPYPSFSDTKHSIGKDETKLILVHEKGVIKYQSPQYWAGNSLNTIENKKKALGSYLRTIFPVAKAETHKEEFNKLPRGEQFQHFKEFAEESGMIVDQAQWDCKKTEYILNDLFQ